MPPYLGGMKTTTRSSGAQGAAPTITPAYLRLPRPGQRCPYCGLTRSALFAALKSGVKSISLRQPGCRRGVRLIHAGSLIEFIERAGQE